MHHHFLSAAFALSLVASAAVAQPKQAAITLTNDLTLPRHELVGVAAQRLYDVLGVDSGTPLVVRGANGQEIASQLSHDGQLLIEASIRPSGTATYTVAPGIPASYPAFVYGRFVPERSDDFAWENDRAAYRAYGPELQRRGEKAYGIDVWVKNEPRSVIDERYRVHLQGDREAWLLRKAGQEAEGNQRSMATSFHVDHGYGYDPYDVGPTLGCGTPALMVDGRLQMPWAFKTYEVLDEGPLRFTVRLNYDSEHRVISLDKGSHFNRMTVTYDVMPRRAQVAAGVVVHTADTTSVVLGSNYALYADPTDNVEVNNSQVYVGVLFPDGGVHTMTQALPEQDGRRWGHALGVKKGVKAGQDYSYYFGAAWSKYDVQSLAQWQLVAEEFLEKQASPIKVEVKKK